MPLLMLGLWSPFPLDAVYNKINRPRGTRKFGFHSFFSRFWGALLRVSDSTFSLLPHQNYPHLARACQVAESDGARWTGPHAEPVAAVSSSPRDPRNSVRYDLPKNRRFRDPFRPRKSILLATCALLEGTMLPAWRPCYPGGPRLSSTCDVGPAG